VLKRNFSGCLLLIALSPAAWGADLFFPDPALTPGALNPGVTQDSIRETVCLAEWIPKQQPPMSYLAELKATQVTALHLEGPASDYAEDHLVPLCVGGHPTDPRNLWPQRVEGDWNFKVKNQFEAAVCTRLCRGELTLEAGRAMFLEPDWREAYLKMFRVE
jgi:hypothetical protein